MSETTREQEQEHEGETENGRQQAPLMSGRHGAPVMCAACKGEGETSRVYPKGGATASYPSGGYYDEAGEWVPVMYRVVDTQYYRCSRAHEWSVDTERFYPSEPADAR